MAQPSHVKRADRQFEDSEQPDPGFPEGGCRAWATVFGAFLIQFCGFGYTTSFGVYQDFYVRDYLSQSSSSAISWIGSVNAFLIISVGLFVGRLYDRGHFHLLIYTGCLVQSFSIFMLSLCRPQSLYQVFLAQGIGAGLGAGITYIPSVAVVSHYFHRRRAFAMTIVASGSSFGAIVHPIMLNNTLHSRLGFGNAVRASAALISALLLAACVLMRPRLPPAQHIPEFWKAVRRFGRDTPYVLATIGMVTFGVAFYFPFFFLQLDATTHGVDSTFSLYALVIMNSAGFVGRLTPGFFAHTLGIPNMVAASAGCGSVVILGMIGLRTVASVVILGILYGYCAGVFITLMPPLVAFLTEDLAEVGLRMGVSFAIEGISGLVGPPINGALLTAEFLWWRPALFSGAMGLIGTAFFLATVVAVRHGKSRKTSAGGQREKNGGSGDGTSALGLPGNSAGG
ncbi:major facilitator superfamily domain-containing protein [Mycena pura]|uniref:Major facilitator superfamily domain-containing protein n=1 Tax=Mycena pura TaxID=153505 RepID=A0AAD6YKM1_9AGAR|nr:major facilitator superfamily domain-containing protein [Mycena pura]